MRRCLVLATTALFLVFNAIVAESAVLKSGSFGCVATAQPPEAASPRLVFAGFWGDGIESAAVLKSIDNGVSWTPVLTGKAAALAADPLAPGVIYAATETGLFKSTDYGDNWSMLNPAIKAWIVVNTGNSSILYGDNLRSTDGGTNWTAMAGLPSLAPPYTFPDRWPHIKVSAGNPDFLIALANGAGAVTRISNDGGLNWTPISGTQRSDYYSVEVDPYDARYYYVGYCNFTQRWYPGGSALTGGISGDIEALAVDGNSRPRLYLSSQSTYTGARSTNFGVAWTSDSTIPGGSRSGRMITERSSPPAPKSAGTASTTTATA